MNNEAMLQLAAPFAAIFGRLGVTEPRKRRMLTGRLAAHFGATQRAALASMQKVDEGVLRQKALYVLLQYQAEPPEKRKAQA